MSRIVGDALVAGAPEGESAPEFVTVRVTRGQAEALAATAELAREKLADAGFTEEADYASSAIASVRAQIGGSR